MAEKEVRAYVLNMEQAIGAYRSYQFPAARAKKLSPTGLVNPPLDLGKLAEFYNESTWHRNAVRVKARDLVGHHWVLEPEFPEGSEPTASEAERELLDTFFWNGGIEDFAQVECLAEPVPLYSSLSEVLERVLIDLDTVGNGYLAVVRDDRAVGPPTWYAHVQGARVRPHKDRVRYRWEQGRQRHWFKRFGLEADVDVQNGQVRPLGSLPLTQRAPELLHFASYTPTDDYYGLPNVTPAIGGMVMDLLAREFNLKFFDNNAVPQYVVLFEGVEDEVSEDTMRVIQDFFASSRGDPTEPWSCPPQPVPPGSPTAASSLRSWRWRSGRGTSGICGRKPATRSWWPTRCPGYRLGLAITGQLGGSNIREADEIYKAEEVDPPPGGAGGTHQPPHSPPGLRHRELVLPLSAVGHQRPCPGRRTPGSSWPRWASSRPTRAGRPWAWSGWKAAPSWTSSTSRGGPWETWWRETRWSCLPSGKRSSGPC